MEERNGSFSSEGGISRKWYLTNEKEESLLSSLLKVPVGADLVGTLGAEALEPISPGLQSGFMFSE